MGNKWAKFKFAAAEIANGCYFDAGKSSKLPREDMSSTATSNAATPTEYMQLLRMRAN